MKSHTNGDANQGPETLGVRAIIVYLQVRGSDMEFRAYGLLYAAVTTPKQLAMELREVPEPAWDQPYMQHALQARAHAHIPCVVQVVRGCHCMK